MLNSKGDKRASLKLGPSEIYNEWYLKLVIIVEV